MKYVWIITDYYWWWLAALSLFLGWDLYRKSGWPSATGVILQKSQDDQKYLRGDEDDPWIPMNETPTRLFSKKPRKTYIKSTIKVEYEFSVGSKTYQAKKVFENIKSDRFFEQLFDPKEVRLPGEGQKVRVYYNPKNPQENSLQGTSFFSALVCVGLGVVFLALGLIFQGP